MATRKHPQSAAMRARQMANRKRILALEAAILALVVQAYQHAERQIAPAQAALLAAYEDELARRTAEQRQMAEDAGEDTDELPPVFVPPAWYSDPHNHTARHYEQTVALAIAAFALASRLHISDGQSQLAHIGADATRETLRKELAPLAAVLGAGVLERALASASHDALAALVGMSASTGKSLAELLGGLGESTVAHLRKAWLSALASGMTGGPFRALLDNTLGMAYRRVHTVLTTELMGAWRGGTSATLQANDKLVAGWIWRAMPDACDVCIAHDGTFHTADETLDSHPHCRCQQEPATRPLSEIANALT
jgi:hypothetical protein